MIDLRCHVLDETGCGPDSFAESLEMCRQAVAGGVRTLVATPRWRAASDAPPVPFADCERKLERLRREVGDAISLRLGFVLPYGPGLPALLAREGERVTLGGGRHALVSLPSLRVPEGADGVWAEVGRLGFSVVVARPECNPALRREPSVLDRWVAAGVKLQLDAPSLLGAYGREVQSFALRCARTHGGAAVVASNARDASERSSSLRQAGELLGRQLGRKPARAVLTDLPESIINGGVAAGENGARTGEGKFLRAITRVFGFVGH